MTNVSAILVTRGDVDMRPVLESLPAEWEKIVYDNGVPQVRVYPPGLDWRKQRDWMEPLRGVLDLSVYGRYAAIEHASHDVIYVQDDDCIVSDPQAIVDAFLACRAPHTECICIHGNAVMPGCPSCDPGHAPFVVCNMPQEFRQFYRGADALVGFGACFHRDVPKRAFDRFQAATGFLSSGPPEATVDVYRRTCDIVFTGLTPTVLVDVEKHDRDFAFADERMYRQPEHVAERQRMRELVAKVRDA